MSTPRLLPLPGESRPRAPLLPAGDVELGLRRPGQRTEGRETGQRAMTCGWLGVCGWVPPCVRSGAFHTRGAQCG